ncbi:MAG: hypothetical protein FIA97_16790 [Methylococcaceae bacterium]|nr:hypothetical protein [Methylococcaceae bacterium]
MSQTSVAAQFYYGNFGQATNTQPQAAQRAEPGDHHHHRVNRDDQVSLSPDARQLQRVEHEHQRDDDPMRALDRLTHQLLKSMMQAFTGREFNLVRPEQPGNQPVVTTIPQADKSGQSGAPPNPADATVPTTTTPAANPFSNAVAAYYQVQSFSLSFSASGTVNTEDGQQMGISVQFSFSQQSYAALAAAGGSTPAANNNTGQPINADFQGLAARLTQTSFNFELDFGGEPTSTQVPANGNAVNPQETATASPHRPDNGTGTTPATTTKPAGTPAANPSPVGGDEAANPLMDALDQLFEKLRIWLHQADGTRQLVAYGINSTTAVYLGTAANTPATPATAEPTTEKTIDPTTALDTVA